MTHIMLDDNEISDRMLEDSIKLCKEWFAMQPHFPKISLDDRTTKRLISFNKFSVEKTKKKLELLLTARSVMPEFFSNRDPWSPDISKALDSVDFIFVPKHTPEYHRVNIFRLNKVNFADYNPIPAVSIAFMVADIRFHMDIMAGDIYVFDGANLTFALAVKLTPIIIKKAMYVVQNCYGSQIKAVHVLNLPPYAEFVVNLSKACMKKKLADRVFVHKSVDDLQNFLPKDVIPKDMGGDYPRTSDDLAEDLRKAVRSAEWRNWYLDYSNHKTDEAMRSKQSETTVDDLLGMMGTFRKLDID